MTDTEDPVARRRTTKLGIVGAGVVGATLAYAAVMRLGRRRPVDRVAVRVLTSRALATPESQHPRG